MQMTEAVERSVERTLGGLVANMSVLQVSVSDFKEQLRLLVISIEADRRERRVECADHWEKTRKLEQDALVHQGTQETMLRDARAQREEIAIAERTRREELATAAVAAQSKIAIEAAEMAEFRTNAEAARTASMSVAEETALRVLASAAKTAKETVATETGARRTQRNWLIERVLPILAGIGLLLGSYFLGGGKLGQ